MHTNGRGWELLTLPIGFIYVVYNPALATLYTLRKVIIFISTQEFCRAASQSAVFFGSNFVTNLKYYLGVYSLYLSHDQGARYRWGEIIVSNLMNT